LVCRLLNNGDDDKILFVPFLGVINGPLCEFLRDSMDGDDNGDGDDDGDKEDDNDDDPPSMPPLENEKFLFLLLLLLLYLK
jgi:hypothetical protein